MDEDRDLTLIKVITMFLARTQSQDIYFANEDLGNVIQQYLNHRIVIQGDSKGISVRLLENFNVEDADKPSYLN